jgi:hypothetical protein
VCVVVTKAVSLQSSQGIEGMSQRSTALPEVERQRGK